MSYGKAEQPCIMYKYWPTNPGLCGVCAWEKAEHPGTLKRAGYDGLQPHQVRVVDELGQLADRRDKLGQFIATDNGFNPINPAFAALPEDEQERLQKQFAIMSQYEDILRDRINHFLPHPRRAETWDGGSRR